MSLDLRTVADATELEPPYAQTRAIAASVLLERRHGARPRDAASLRDDEGVRPAEIVRCTINDRSRATYDEPLQCTEEAAEAIAFTVARQVLQRVVYGRMKTRTGADYRLRPPGAPETDVYERLEVSGIGDGTDTCEDRLHDKLRRFARYPDEPAGFAIITDFGENPVEIRIGRYEP